MRRGSLAVRVSVRVLWLAAALAALPAFAQPAERRATAGRTGLERQVGECLPVRYTPRDDDMERRRDERQYALCRQLGRARLQQAVERRTLARRQEERRQQIRAQERRQEERRQDERRQEERRQEARRQDELRQERRQQEVRRQEVRRQEMRRQEIHQQERRRLERQQEERRLAMQRRR